MPMGLTNFAIVLYLLHGKLTNWGPRHVLGMDITFRYGDKDIFMPDNDHRDYSSSHKNRMGQRHTK